MTRPAGAVLAPLLVVPAFVLAACGGGDEGGDKPTSRDDKSSGSATASDESTAETTTELTTESTAESSAASPDPADLAIAEAALLRLDDFPFGWQAVPGEDEDEDEVANHRAVAECVGVEYEDLYDESNAEAKSPDFTNEDDEEVAVTVTVDSSEAEMVEAFETAASEKYRECIADLAGKSMKEAVAEAENGAEIGEVTLNEVSLGSYGDETIAFRVSVPITVDGASIETTLDAVLVRVGRAMTYVSGTRFDIGSLSTEEIAGYVKLATRRLETAIAKSP